MTDLETVTKYAPALAIHVQPGGYPTQAQYLFAYINQAQNPNPTTPATSLGPSPPPLHQLPPFSPTATPILRTPAAAPHPSRRPHPHPIGEHRGRLPTLVIALTPTQPATAAEGSQRAQGRGIGEGILGRG